jgi:hypothetical protein
VRRRGFIKARVPRFRCRPQPILRGPEAPFHGFWRIPDAVDRLEPLGRYAEFLRPVAHLVVVAETNARMILRTPLRFVVCHDLLRYRFTSEPANRFRITNPRGGLKKPLPMAETV